MIRVRNRHMSRMRFPKKIQSTSDFETFVYKQVCLPYLPTTPPLSRESRILTIGSCFSANLATALKQEKFNVINYVLSERLFTTFALKDFFSGLQNGHMPPQLIDDVEENKNNLEHLRQALVDGCTVIFTLGMSMCWFEIATNTLVHDPVPRTLDGIEKKGGDRFFKTDVGTLRNAPDQRR